MAQNEFEASPPKTDENYENHSRRDRSSRSSTGGIIPTKLYVKRIPESVTSKELNDLFATYGNVTECAIIRSYAFVHFSSAEEANRALEELNGYRFMGVTLEIEQSNSHSRTKRVSNRRDVYRKDEYGGRRERDRSPAYTGAYRADPYSSPTGYGGYPDYGPSYGGYNEGYGGYMSPYRAPPRRGGYHHGPGPRYMGPPPPPPQQYNNFSPGQGYQSYGPPRPRGPPPHSGYYPPN